MTKWTAFMAGLWFKGRGRGSPLVLSRPVLGRAVLGRPVLGRAVRRIALVLSLVVLPGCSELAQPSQAAAPPAPPSYVSLAAKYLLAALKDRSSYSGFEISGLRWVDSINGWAWLACVRFQDRGHLRSYAIFIQDNAVADARYAVETDRCEAQSYTQFDLVTGELGRPTAPVQSPLY
jgi:hypothetical protein